MCIRDRNTVDGKVFATARGWEDLSQLIQVYEMLEKTVDRDVVYQYIQHKMIAKDLDVYKRQSLLYAVVTVYISGMFMDHMLENADAKNLMIVIAESTDKVRQVFLDRKIGVTVLKGEGGYSSEVQRVVMCVSEKKECELLQKRIDVYKRQHKCFKGKRRKKE